VPVVTDVMVGFGPSAVSNTAPMPASLQSITGAVAPICGTATATNAAAASNAARSGRVP
jgi:hypothetical protein